MRITVFNGSPAGKNSATHKMVQEILTGIDEGAPLYVDNVSGIMKLFFDRCLSLGAPYVGKDDR